MNADHQALIPFQNSIFLTEFRLSFCSSGLLSIYHSHSTTALDIEHGPKGMLQNLCRHTPHGYAPETQEVAVVLKELDRDDAWPSLRVKGDLRWVCDLRVRERDSE